MPLTPYPSLATLPEVVANGGKLPAHSIDVFSGRTIYASSIPGVVLDCDIFARTKIGGGTPTDNAAAINAVLATATATNPVQLIIDGGSAMSVCPIIPVTGNVTISGQGMSTGFYILPASNQNGLQNFANTDLARDLAAHPTGSQGGQGKDVTLRNFRIDCNKGTYPNGNSNGHRDGTFAGHGSDSDTPSAKGGYPNTGYWLSGITLVGLDNVTIDNVWVYDSPTYGFLLGHCTNVNITSCRSECVSVAAQDNTDGIHLNGGCSNVRIDGCYIKTGDDAFALNFNEGDGTPGGDVVVTNCYVDALALGRVYGMNTATNNRIQFHNITGVVRWWGIILGEGNSQVDTGVETNHSVLIDGIDVQISSGGGPISPAMVIVAGNTGVIELRSVKVISPQVAHPLVLMANLNSSVSCLRIVDCGVHRDAAGSAAAYAVEASHSGSTIADLAISDFHVTEQYGQSYTDIAALVNVAGSAIGTLSISGRFRGVGKLVNVASGSVAGIDAPDIYHKSNAGSPTARSFVAAGSTVPVSLGRYNPVNLAGPGTGTLLFTGPGIAGQSLADAMVGNLSPYYSSTQTSFAVKVGGIVNTFTTSAVAAHAVNALSLVQASNTNQGTPLTAGASSSNSHFQANGGSYTIGAFVKFTTLTAALHGIMTKWNDGNTAREYNLCYSNGTGQMLFFSNSGGGTDTYILGSTVITTGVWYFVVAGYDTGTGKLFLYLNAVSDATTVTAPQTQSSNSTFVIGSFINNPVWATDGLISMAFKYNSALSGTLITWLYNAGAGRSTAEILAHAGLTTPDFLYGFDNAGALGSDSGPNTLTLTSAFATPPTQGVGPG